MTPIDAERAFAADAKTIGQWTAFRKWSTDYAVMFVQNVVNAHVWLKDRKDPQQAIDWWPTASFVSCDDSLAVNTGGWRRPDGSVGYFTTVWQRQQGDGWKWIIDFGDAVKIARPASPVKIVRAACNDKRNYTPSLFGTGPSAPISSDEWLAQLGGSKDSSLVWMWLKRSDGSRIFSVNYWNGLKRVSAIHDVIAAPSK